MDLWHYLKWNVSQSSSSPEKVIIPGPSETIPYSITLLKTHPGTPSEISDWWEDSLSDNVSSWSHLQTLQYSENLSHGASSRGQALGFYWPWTDNSFISVFSNGRSVLPFSQNPSSSSSPINKSPRPQTKTTHKAKAQPLQEPQGLQLLPAGQPLMWYLESRPLTNKKHFNYVSAGWSWGHVGVSKCQKQQWETGTCWVGLEEHKHQVNSLMVEGGLCFGHAGTLDFDGRHATILAFVLFCFAILKLPILSACSAQGPRTHS